MKITYLVLNTSALLASTHICCMDKKAIGLKPLPASYQLGSNGHTAQAQQMVAANPSTEHGDSNPLSVSLHKQQRQSRLQSLLREEPTVITTQQEISNLHELIGSADATAKVGLSIALMGLVNYFVNMIQVRQSDTSGFIYPMLAGGANLITTAAATGVTINRCTKKAYLMQQLEELHEALEELNNDTLARTDISTVHEKIGSYNAASTGLFILLTLCTLNAIQDGLIVYFTDGTIPLIAESVNAGIGVIASGLLIRSLLHLANNKQLAKTLNTQLDQLMPTEQEQEEM